MATPGPGLQYCKFFTRTAVGEQSAPDEVANLQARPRSALRSLGRNLLRVMSMLKHGRDYQLESPSENT
jgi:hypothetical protein